MHRTKTTSLIPWSLCLLASLLLNLLLTAPTFAKSEKQLHHFRFLAFGTYIEVMIAGVSKTRANNANTLIQQQFQQMHKRWHSWNQSGVSQLNTAFRSNNSNTWHVIPSDVIALLVRAKKISIMSGHKFNPAIAQLVKLWGFNDAYKPRKKPPPPKQIQQLVKQQPRMSDLQINKNRVRNLNPALQLDFGAIAKGYAIDRVINLLKKQGIQNIIINAGGDLKAIGRHPQRAWHIAIRDPKNKAQLIAGIEINGEESVFTSGNYERFFNYKGKRYHHILDPATGYPVQHTRSVTVIHKDATLADAASTALFVAGPKQWRTIAKKLGVRYVMLIDQNGVIHLTKAMQQRIKIFGKHHIVIAGDINGKH